MATNATTDDAVDDSKTVTEEDLRNLKYSDDGVETSKEEDEPTDEQTEEDESTDEAGEEVETNDQATDDEADDESEEAPTFVKEFKHIKGDTPEEYARNLEEAYKNSTTEALRLKGLVDTAPKEPGIGETTDDEVDFDPSNPVSLYMKQKMDEEIVTAFTEFSAKYPQVNDTLEYNKFTQEVSVLSQTIMKSQKRLAPPKELYAKAAAILGWKPDKVTDKDRLGDALKNSAASPKPSSSAPKKPVKSKVTDAQVAAHKAMYPGKTDAQIRKELEPYV